MKKNRNIDLFDGIIVALLVFMVLDAMRHAPLPPDLMEETKVVDEIFAASPVIVDVGTGLSVQDR